MHLLSDIHKQGALIGPAPNNNATTEQTPYAAKVALCIQPPTEIQRVLYPPVKATPTTLSRTYIMVASPRLDTNLLKTLDRAAVPEHGLGDLSTLCARPLY